MNTILDELKTRLAFAQKRHVEAQQRFQVAQAELQLAQQEFAIWNTAVNIETKDESVRAAAAAKDQIPMQLSPASEPDAIEEHVANVSEPVNKTEAVRDLLRQHPAGMNPSDLWKMFREKLPGSSRAYLYSVLKRLRDKEEVMVRRGKYMLKVKPSEVKQEGSLIN